MNFRRSRWRSALLIAEMAFSLVLLAGAGLLIRTFVAKRVVSRGFDEQNVLTMDMSLNNPRFEKTSEVAELVRHAERRLAAVPVLQRLRPPAFFPWYRPCRCHSRF